MTQEIIDLTEECFISNDPDTIGFDLSSGKKWIYPENYPRRDYQFTIVQTALYNNTLVCLPTGLGKTFIAAVIMYNFWRWYPQGRVVFLAPTKPLVTQQIHACNEIMGIPNEETVELTGAVNQNKRQQAWAQKRVIFATPQTFQKDLQNNYVPYELIKCIVFDEAHKALGKHTYCEIINLLNEKTKFFRVLALSATPGNKIEHVREVIQNLHISKLELRDDNSPDIIPYTNDKSVESVIVFLSKELSEYKERYINIMDRHVRILINNKILRGNVTNISRGKIFMLRKQYESTPRKRNNHGVIMKTLNILLTMYHAYDLLIKHGLRAFYNFYSNHSEKFWLETELDLQLLLKNIEEYIGNLPVIQSLNDGTILDIPDRIIFGHNKFYKLSDLLIEHFNSFSQQKKSTRAIVFVEYRDIVNEIYILLLQKRPLIRPQMFVGRAGLKQKQQIKALEDFRNNKVNVLISTSVGEEGLDVGEVDLIVCFDISSSTPIRLVQRMGRTGRKRTGRVIALLTAGKEEENFNEALIKKNSLNNKVLQSSNITFSLYESSPRMVPLHITPQCLPIFIKTQPKMAMVESKTKKQSIAKYQRKKRKDDTLDDNYTFLPTTSKVDFNTKNSENTQSTMMKFLTDQHLQRFPCVNKYDSDSGILSEEFKIVDNKANIEENPYAVIKPKDVKLITSDSHALEFLTLCAMKKSEQKISDQDAIRINKTWIPIHSPVDIFRDFQVPSVDNLDCIKNIILYNGPIEDESKSNSNESICNYLNYVQSDTNIIENCSFVESKYAQIFEKMNLIEQKQIDVGKSDFFDDFSITGSKYIEKSEKTNLKNQNVEILMPDLFNNACFAFDFKHYHSKNSNSKIEENTDFLKKKLSTFVRVKDSRKSQETLIQNDADVEVDFHNILDECTESEESQSQSLINNQFEKKNNFDDLLDEASSDDDIFSFNQDQNNVTIMRNAQNNDTILHSPKFIAKRSASNSPCPESAKKKQRVSDIDLSDTESTIIFGTPQKIKKIRPLFDCNNSIGQLVSENVHPDSDQDLFDDLDFETQFSFTSKKDEISFENKENNASFQNEKDKELHNKLPFVEKLDQISQKKIKNEKKISWEDTNEDEKLPLIELSLIENNLSFYDIEKEKKIKDKQFSNDQKSESHSFEKWSMMNISDLHLDDWNDDFDFVVPAKNWNKEKFSNSFSNNVNSTVRTTKIKESSSSSWNSIDITRETTNNQTKIVQKPNNFKVTTIVRKLTDASISEKKLNSINFEDKHKIFNVRNTVQPKLRLINLTKNFTDRIDKNKDNVHVSQCKVNVSSEIKMNEFTVLNEPRKNCNNKEYKLPSLRDYKEESNINSQFRKHNSENTKCNKKNKARGIANDFIDNEAEVSSNNETSEGSSEEDGDLTNFVSYTQEQSDAVDMKAHYLQTLNKSPIRSGAFMFKPLKNLIPDTEIYSQPSSQVDDSYVNDSFCVENTACEDNCSDNSSSDSILENIELKLESRRSVVRRKKRLKFKDLEIKKRQKNNKRYLKNYGGSSTNSSEDETEALRKQVLEESRLIKQLQS